MTGGAPYLQLEALCRARGWVLGIALEPVAEHRDEADALAATIVEYRLKVYDSRPIRRARVLASESAGKDGKALDDAARVALAALRMAPPPEPA